MTKRPDTTWIRPGVTVKIRGDIRSLGELRGKTFEVKTHPNVDGVFQVKIPLAGGRVGSMRLIVTEVEKP